MNATEAPQILIVDDMPTNIEVLLRMLADDYDVRVATSGREALNFLAKGEPPDLILLDVVMPQMDGYQVCAALKGEVTTRHIPVIFITARGDAESETQALLAGGVDFIHKPVNQDVLRARVRLHLELKEHREHLEALVHARTRELAAARDAAETANRAKSAFLANISHELLTPLNHIIGNGHLLAKDLQEERPKARLAKIQQAAGQQLTLINNVLDYANSEANQIQIESIAFDLVALLAMAADGIRRSAEEKGLELVREVDPVLPRWLTGDPRRLQQVLGQLLSNAVKFSAHGRVTLRVRLVETHTDRLSVRFEVEDQGIGIATEMQDGLFQLFNQGDNTLTRKYGGTGLGLALSRRLVSLMAGDLGYTSTPGKGSLFWFSVRLPISAAPPGQATMTP